MITAKQLLAVFPKCRDSNLIAQVLGKVAPEFDINTKERFSMWLAQVGHESDQFRALRENLSYSVPGLMKTWPRRFPTEEHAAPFARQPERLANYVYADRLGNGNFKSGDGWRFRGGGWIQLTGRTNYRVAGKALDLPLEEQPQRIENMPVAARTAALFWKQQGLNEACDRDIDWAAFQAICHRINGGNVGLKERFEAWAKVRAVLA